jgi:hypothetical protein
MPGLVLALVVVFQPEMYAPVLAACLESPLFEEIDWR